MLEFFQFRETLEKVQRIRKFMNLYAKSKAGFNHLGLGENLIRIWGQILSLRQLMESDLTIKVYREVSITHLIPA